MQHVALARSYMAIGSCWDRWGRLYTCRRRCLTLCLRASRLHRRQCERGGELFAIIVPSSSPSSSSSVSRRPSNEFGNFIYRDRGEEGELRRGAKWEKCTLSHQIVRGKGASVATYNECERRAAQPQARMDPIGWDRIG